jgi:hypothetical protein
LCIKEYDINCEVKLKSIFVQPLNTNPVLTFGSNTKHHPTSRGFVGQAIVFPLLILLSFSLSSCFTYYGIANWSEPAFVYEKPAYQGYDRDTFYLSSRSSIWIGGSEETANGYVDLYHYSLSVNRSYSRKWYSLSYGSFAYLGNYSARPVLEYPRQNLAYYGSGGSLEATTNITVGNLIIRPIGVKATLMGEFGPYARFRKDLAEAVGEDMHDNYIFVLTDRNLTASIGVTQELLLSFPKWEIGTTSLVGMSDSEVFLSTVNRFRIHSWSFDSGLYYSGQGFYPSFGLSHWF